LSLSGLTCAARRSPQTGLFLVEFDPM